MAGDLAGGVEAGDRAPVAQATHARAGGEAAERVGDGADQWPGEEWRRIERTRPVRLRRRELGLSRETIAVRGIEAAEIAGARRVVLSDRLFQMLGVDADLPRQSRDVIGANRRHLRA